MLDGCSDKSKDRKCGPGPKCELCPHKPFTHEYVLHLYQLHLVGLAGFPFSAGDLPFQTWEDIGRLRQAIAAKMRAF